MFNYYLNGGSATVDGSVYGTSFTVTDGGVLSGKGSIYATVINDGAMAPGQLTLYQPLSLGFTSNYVEQISGPDDFGMLTDHFGIILGGNLIIQLAGGYVPSLGDTFQFIDAPDYLDAFMSSTTIAINGFEEFKVLYDSAGVELCVVPDATPVCAAPPPGPVPEPSSIVLLGTAAMIAAWQLRKRGLRKQADPTLVSAGHVPPVGLS